MYVEIVPNRNSPPAILLREGWREGKKTLTLHKKLNNELKVDQAASSKPCRNRSNSALMASLAPMVSVRRLLGRVRRPAR